MNDEYETRVVAIRRYLEGAPPARIYTSLGRSSTWFFKWRQRYNQMGLDGLHDLSKAPKHQPHQTSEALETAIVTMRKLREKRERDETKYALIGAFAIHEELQKLGYEPPSVRTVHKILVRNGVVVAPPEPKSVREVIDRHYPCLEMTRPGELQQLDVVGPRYLTGSRQKYYFYNLRDVCSRKLALDVGKNHRAATIVKALIQAIPMIIKAGFELLKNIIKRLAEVDTLIRDAMRELMENAKEKILSFMASFISV